MWGEAGCSVCIIRRSVQSSVLVRSLMAESAIIALIPAGGTSESPERRPQERPQDSSRLRDSSRDSGQLRVEGPRGYRSPATRYSSPNCRA